MDDLLPTGPVLRRALAKLDVGQILRALDDPAALQDRLRDAVKDAALAEAEDRLVGKLPGALRRILGL